MDVRQVMETDIITATPDMSVRDVAEIMHRHDLSSLPVIDGEGSIVGIVSEHDLIYRLARPHLPPHIELLGGVIYLENPFEMKRELEKLTAVNVEDIMETDVVSIGPDASVEDAATLMVEKDINGIPVVQDQRLVGIITRHDLLSALAGKSASENDSKEEQ